MCDLMRCLIVCPSQPHSLTHSPTHSLAHTNTTKHSQVLVQKSSAGVTINGNSKVITADIAAANGVVHIIDTVLMPPTAGKDAEVKAVWSQLLKQHADAMHNWQKNWKDKGTPLYKDTKKKTVSSTATEFLFTFANKCVLEVEYDTKKQGFAIQSKNCPGQKCEDNESVIKAISAKFKVVGRFVENHPAQHRHANGCYRALFAAINVINCTKSSQSMALSAMQSLRNSVSTWH